MYLLGYLWLRYTVLGTSVYLDANAYLDCPAFFLLPPKLAERNLLVSGTSRIIVRACFIRVWFRFSLLACLLNISTSIIQLQQQQPAILSSPLRSSTVLLTVLQDALKKYSYRRPHGARHQGAEAPFAPSRHASLHDADRSLLRRFRHQGSSDGRVHFRGYSQAVFQEHWRLCGAG